MISIDDFRTVHRLKSTRDLAIDYDSRNKEGMKLNDLQFNVFLSALNKDLSSINKKHVDPLLFSIGKMLVKNPSNKELIMSYYGILLETSKPKTTDHSILSSSDFQFNQMFNPKYNELSYEKKYDIIFSIIFKELNVCVQKQFLKLLKKCNYNPSLDLLCLMTLIDKYRKETMTFEELIDMYKVLTTVKGIKEISSKVVANTTHGKIPMLLASENLGITDLSLLKQGKCNEAVNTYLRELPNFYGAYYIIPNYFGGYFEHSVMIDYENKLVYDLSHDTVLPLKFFERYYKKPEFVISGRDFNELDKQVQEEFGYKLRMEYIDGIRRNLKK